MTARLTRTFLALLFLFALTMTSLSPSQIHAAPDPADVPEFVSVWGSTGSGNGEVSQPWGIVTDSSGIVYIADSANNRIQKFTSDGTYLTQWGTAGSGDGEFNDPTDVATDSQNNIYVMDSSNHRIQKFTSDGTFITKWGSNGTGDGQFSFATGFTVDGSGNVYVADNLNHRIQKFTSDGTFITKWGSSGTGDGQFSRPTDVYTDSSGNVYVSQRLNPRIQKFTSEGTFITKWGAPGSENGEFGASYGIAVDLDNNIYLADTDNSRIQKFTADGTYLTQWGSSGTGEGEFFSPRGITVDAEGNVYVTDIDQDRIQKFSYPPESASLTAPNSSAAIRLESANAFTTFTCSETVTEASLAAPDTTKDYPLGLIDFCLDVEEGSTQTITITFETNLTPSEVTAKKYIPASNTYIDVPDAEITETTLDGNPALQLTYDITDGGELDDDGLANGTILDPVGLAVDPEVAAELADSEDAAALADTGQSQAVVLASSIVLFGAAALGLRRCLL